MNAHDWEFLNKQMRGPSLPRSGTIVLTVVATFLAGITVGGILFAHRSEPTRTASNYVSDAISFPSGPQLITR
jgi:uncharacterized membrane protein